MATTTTPATETSTVTILAVSPKLLTAIKALVSKDLAYQADRGKRLITIEELLRDEKARGLSKKKLNLELLENGMDAPTASKLLSFVFTEYEEEVLKVNAHNAEQEGKRTGMTVKFDAKRAIAKGETTLAKVLAEMANPPEKNNVNKGQGKTAAKAATATATAPEPEKFTEISAKAAIVRVLEKMEKDGLGTPEECAAIAEQAIELFMEDEPIEPETVLAK